MKIRNRKSIIRIKHLGVWSISAGPFLTWLKKQIEGDDNFGQDFRNDFCYGDLTATFRLVKRKEFDYHLEKMTIEDVVREYIKIAYIVKDNFKAQEMGYYYVRMTGKVIDPRNL